MSGIHANVAELDALAERFNALSLEKQAEFAKLARKMGLELVGYIKTNKLQGQVLHQRSGNLSRHITEQQTIDHNGIREQVGVFAGVPYAAIHEYGGTYLRTNSKRGMGTYVTVPERSYLRTALAEKVGDYAKRFAKLGIPAKVTDNE